MTNANYYYHQRDLNRTFAIGNSTNGWAFSLVVNVYPSLLHWKEAWRIPGSYISLDFGRRIKPEEMETIITFRKGNPSSLMVALSNRDSFHGPHDLACHFIGSHNLIHQIVGTRAWGYECLANKDCYDICLTYKD